jgi:hypothetical protein
MACHVYDFVYYKVLTILVCDMQFEDIKTQRFMWTKLIEMMLKHRFPKPNFKEFMVDNAQANWNVIKIVYGLRDPYVRMVDKEHTYLFHWIESFNKHTEQMIKLSCKMNIRLFAISTTMPHPLGTLIGHYALIRCWWLSFRVAYEVSAHELSNWLSLWHFYVRQWGGFMVHVSTYSLNFL